MDVEKVGEHAIYVKELSMVDGVPLVVQLFQNEAFTCEYNK